MLHFDVDVSWEAEIVDCNRVHVEDESGYRSETHNRPPAFLYRPYTRHQTHRPTQ